MFTRQRARNIMGTTNLCTKIYPRLFSYPRAFCAGSWLSCSAQVLSTSCNPSTGIRKFSITAALCEAFQIDVGQDDEDTRYADYKWDEYSLRSTHRFMTTMSRAIDDVMIKERAGQATSCGPDYLSYIYPLANRRASWPSYGEARCGVSRRSGRWVVICN